MILYKTCRKTIRLVFFQRDFFDDNGGSGYIVCMLNNGPVQEYSVSPDRQARPVIISTHGRFPVVFGAVVGADVKAGLHIHLKLTCISLGGVFPH